MPKDPQKNMDELMEPLRQRYLERLDDHHKKLQAMLSAAERKPLTDAEYEDLHFLVHNLIGTGKIFGFPKITEIGTLIEKHIIATPRAKETVIINDLKKFLAACGAARSTIT